MTADPRTSRVPSTGDIVRPRSVRRASAGSLVLLGILGIASCDSGSAPPPPRPQTLAEWGLFDGDGSTQQPVPGVVPFDVISPLFSDYARKHRFIQIPSGTTITYSDTERWGFPVGSVLVKTFGFLRDERDPSVGEKLVETRLLVHETDGWHGYVYRWNDANTAATLLDVGENATVSQIDASGNPRSFTYRVPSRFECNRCHQGVDDPLGPIGPRTRQLDRLHDYGGGPVNQLDHMASLGMFDVAPATARVALVDPMDTSIPLDARARAYLDANCSHCHRAAGAASGTGLLLDATQTDPFRLGVCKSPVAAGPGAGGLDLDIVAGDPDQSIMVYRMSSLAAAVKMPELPNLQLHTEGIALIRAWIAAMPPTTCP